MCVKLWLEHLLRPPKIRVRSQIFWPELQCFPNRSLVSVVISSAAVCVLSKQILGECLLRQSLFYMTAFPWLEYLFCIDCMSYTFSRNRPTMHSWKGFWDPEISFPPVLARESAKQSAYSDIAGAIVMPHFDHMSFICLIASIIWIPGALNCSHKTLFSGAVWF